MNMPANDRGANSDNRQNAGNKSQGSEWDCMYLRPKTPDLLDLKILVASGGTSLQARIRLLELVNEQHDGARQQLRYLFHQPSSYIGRQCGQKEIGARQ